MENTILPQIDYNFCTRHRSSKSVSETYTILAAGQTDLNAVYLILNALGSHLACLLFTLLHPHVPYMVRTSDHRPKPVHCYGCVETVTMGRQGESLFFSTVSRINYIVICPVGMWQKSIHQCLWLRETALGFHGIVKWSPALAQSNSWSRPVGFDHARGIFC